MDMPYDKEKEFEEIRELFESAAKECHMRGIPCFWCAAVKDNPDNTKYMMSGITPASIGIQLKDNKFPQFTMLLRSGHLP